MRLHAEAVSDIDEVFRYYEAEQSGLGHSFLRALEHGYGQIEDFPNAWPRVEPEGRWYILRKFPFAIVYIEDRGDRRHGRLALEPAPGLLAPASRRLA